MNENKNNEERTLDEALDAMDGWSEQMVRDLEGLSPDEMCEYFSRAQAEFEQKMGKPLNLPVRRAPKGENV
jgi:hypothetical protein